jgi:hypothetical protein
VLQPRVWYEIASLLIMDATRSVLLGGVRKDTVFDL